MKAINPRWTVLLFVCATSLWATDEWTYPTFDTHYFDNVRVSTSTQILRVQARPFEQQDKQVLKLRYYPTFDSTQGILCTLSRGVPYWPFTLDCGLRTLGYEADQETVTYYFLLQNVDGSRFEIYKDPNTSATAWLDREAAGKSYTLLSVPQWLALGTTFQAIPEVAERGMDIYQEPNLSSDRVAIRTLYRFKYGALPEDGFPVGDRSRTPVNEWIPVEWVKPSCAPTVSVRLFCNPKGTSSNAPSMACVSGWLRWKTNEGRLLFYPFFTSAQDCPSSASPSLFD